MQKNKKTIICILGMHRSGTSMMTRLLNICGVYIDEEKNLFPAGKGNPKGHWEHKESLDIDRAVLSLIDFNFYKDFSMPDNWQEKPEFKKLLGRARKFVNYMNSKSDIWGFKDPRMCLTLPFWQEIIPDMKYVIMVRDPFSVANSLNRRDGTDNSIGELNWALHWGEILKNTSSDNRIFVIYDKLLINWNLELEKVLKYVNLEKLSLRDKSEEIESFIDVNLRHYKSFFNFIPYDELEKQLDYFVKYIKNKRDYVKNCQECVQNRVIELEELRSKKDLLTQELEEVNRNILKKNSELNNLKKDFKVLKESKSFLIGNLFFRSIKSPRKLITFPINFLRILKK